MKHSREEGEEGNKRKLRAVEEEAKRKDEEEFVTQEAALESKL